jgi:hypothetical protein
LYALFYYFDSSYYIFFALILSLILCTTLYLLKCSYVNICNTHFVLFTCETHYVCFSLCFICEQTVFSFTMFSHVRVSAVTLSLCFQCEVTMFVMLISAVHAHSVFSCEYFTEFTCESTTMFHMWTHLVSNVRKHTMLRLHWVFTRDIVNHFSSH